MTGIVIVDKPAGWTSQDVAARLRRVFGTRRIGHGGTLDPMATGVLPVFVGRATRAVQFFGCADKTYLATLRLGLRTDTEDTTGTVLAQSPADVSDAELLAAVGRFRGEIDQVPPMYSAIKVGGRKLCDLARKGAEVERRPRRITVYALDILGREGSDVRLKIHCSKGTYIRTLCKDIGETLGCGGCMAELRRVQAGQFTIDRAVPLAELTKAADPAAYLLPVDTLFADRPALSLTLGQEKAVRNGAAYSAPLPDGEYRLYGSGEFLALGRTAEGKMTTVKSFFAVEE